MGVVCCGTNKDAISG